ncbi:hypothetical protein FDP41_002903 [Naegleria fowleri]|uniref:Poly [ADP-ribose] polymerase n=1 Tax=Naegleria fowleri TaxID=5763 RepID=A0A6A5BX78_NAEFO|nr:uncharacterized protein FDP41_002903 [Naegleria fowleri]KAF0978388.1 hypothetical protein FDP41_002903 [Naegleria fowleri]
MFSNNNHHNHNNPQQVPFTSYNHLPNDLPNYNHLPSNPPFNPYTPSMQHHHSVPSSLILNSSSNHPFNQPNMTTTRIPPTNFFSQPSSVPPHQILPNTAIVPTMMINSPPPQTPPTHIHTGHYDPAIFGNVHPHHHMPQPSHGFSGPVIMPPAQNLSSSTYKNSQNASPQKYLSTNSKQSSSNLSQSGNSTMEKKDKIPEPTNFCRDWKKCSLTRLDEQHKCEFRHLCTIKNCDKWKENKTHKARFIHICAHGKKCHYQDNEDHTHNFIHPCTYGSKCNYLSDPLHRIRFSHDDLDVDDNFDWSDTWTTSPPNSITKISKKYTRLFSLPKTSDECKKIEAKFLKSVQHSHSSAQVIKIERIENAQKWEEYTTLRYHIQCKNKGNANEKILYHGCDADTAQKIIGSEYGFDYRLTTTGFYGQGAYFAVNASYSHGYTKASSNVHVSCHDW